MTAETTSNRRNWLFLVMALIGGGTMNVSARWCGWTQKPALNFRRVVKMYLEDRLITRDVSPGSTARQTGAPASQNPATLRAGAQPKNQATAHRTHKAPRS